MQCISMTRKQYQYTPDCATKPEIERLAPVVGPAPFAPTLGVHVEVHMTDDSPLLLSVTLAADYRAQSSLESSCARMSQFVDA